MNTETDSLGLIPAPLSITKHDGCLKEKHAEIQPTVWVPMDKPLGFTDAEEPEKEQLRKDAFILEITDKGIFITAHDRAGEFYAKQTLRQLSLSICGAEDNEGALTNLNFKEDDPFTIRTDGIPFCRIEDAPAFEWRGFMIDTCRNYFSPQFLIKMLDIAALHKLNKFHWHLTDDQGWRFPVDGYENVISTGAYRIDHRYTWYPERVKGGFYPQNIIGWIVWEASQRHIEIIPEIETAGHTLALLASYPELGCTGEGYKVEDRFGIFDDVVCAGNDKVLEFFSTAFASLKKLFPDSRYIHIGGDECPRSKWWECPKCRSRVIKENLWNADQLQAWLTDRYISTIENEGEKRTVIGYEEVIDNRDREKNPLDKSVLVQHWGNDYLLQQALENGNSVIMSPQNEGCYLDASNYDEDMMEPGALRTRTVKDSYSFNPYKDVPENRRKQIVGCQGMLWTEIVYSPRQAEYMLFPRLCALSEVFWKNPDPEGKEESFKEFSKRLAIHKQRLDTLDVVYYKGKLEKKAY